jgi:hypothetical protein
MFYLGLTSWQPRTFQRPLEPKSSGNRQNRYPISLSRGGGVAAYAAHINGPPTIRAIDLCDRGRPYVAVSCRRTTNTGQ